jgi:DNA-binding SARP family transcriptional activator/TolB-like protein
MITLHVSGTVELKGSDGRSLLSILSQPKRTALLAYLTLADPCGFHRRDTLLGIFWPELGEQRARNALSQALHYLRRSLGDGVVVTRGEGEVGIAEGAVWCDAVAFEEAIRGGRLAEALDLYRGEVLTGLNLNGVPEFERWLDLVRARKRELAASAAWELARRAEETGDVSSAAALARRAAGLQPDDESVLRRLLTQLDRLGDCAGALHAYEAFSRRLEAEFAAEPAPATRELIAQIRRGSDDGGGQAAVPDAADSPRAVGAPGAVGTPGSVGTPDAVGIPGVVGIPDTVGIPGTVDTPAPDALTTPRTARGWPRPAFLAGGLAVLLVLLAYLVIPGPFRNRSGERGTGGAGGAPRAVAVLPFELRGGTEIDYLTRGMTDLLSAKLDGAARLRSVDPRAVLATVPAATASMRDLRWAGRIAERLGAELFVLGSITAHGGSVQLSASLYERERVEPVTRAVVEGAADQLFELVDRLAAELLASEHRGPGQDLVRLAATTTTSLPALKAYLLGEEALRAGHYVLAGQHFHEAASIDTTFALAYYRLGVAAVWGEQGSMLSYGAVERALRHGDRLSERGRNLLEAFRAYLNRNAVEAERLYRTVLASHPDDVEAWYQLGEVLFHYRPLLGWPLEESAIAFERVLEFEPGHGEAMIHLARIAARRGDRAAVDTLVDRLVGGSEGRERQAELQALRAAVRRDRAEWARITASAQYLREETITTLIVVSSVHGGDLEAALQLARLLTHPTRDPFYRGLGHGLAAQIELARGRWASAREQLVELARLEPTSAAFAAAIFAAMPFTPASTAEVEALRETVAAVDDGVAPGTLRSFGLKSVHLPFVRHYLTGLLSARLGDRDGAQMQLRTLELLGGLPGDPVLGPGLARSITAAIAWSGGAAGATLRELEMVPFGPQHLKAALAYAAQGYERFLFGEALVALGRDDEALRWFGSFPEPAGYDLIYLAPSHLRRAEIHDRQGDLGRAALHYGRFVELWAECDTELRPLVEAAAERLEALRSAGRPRPEGW